MHVVGATRIRNEVRWIDRMLRSFLPVCERIFVLDDHSTDGTVEAIAAMHEPRVIVIRSLFTGLNESRDKDFLLSTILKDPDYQTDKAGYHWPDWCAMPDGDEILDQRDVPTLKALFADEALQALQARIVYLWDNEQTVRTDGVYGQFYRPTFFRVINEQFGFQTTPFGTCPETGGPANFHCSSIPQEMLAKAVRTTVRLNHLGYLHREDRIRKLAWYRRVDGDSPAEDNYRHICLGDLPETPADMVTLHAGPLRLEPFE